MSGGLRHVWLMAAPLDPVGTAAPRSNSRSKTSESRFPTDLPGSTALSFCFPVSRLTYDAEGRNTAHSTRIAACRAPEILLSQYDGVVWLQENVDDAALLCSRLSVLFAGMSSATSPA